MALPIVIASNQTGGAITLDRLGLTVPASSTLTLTLYSFVNEIRQDESLHAAIVADEILLDLGQGELSKGDSLKFFAVQVLEVRRAVRALATGADVTLSGTTTIDSVSLAVDDRVLLTNQTTTPSENGIWVVKAGAWQRPSDFAVGDSAGSALISIQEGTTHADQVWQVTTNTGSDIVGTNDLAVAQISGGGGGGGTLQEAYEAGNTIAVTSGEGPLAFTLTSDSFTVDGAGGSGFLIGGTTPVAAFNVDAVLGSLDFTDTANLTMTANVAADRTLTIAASNSDGGGDGLIAMSADGEIDIDSGGALSLNSSGGVINIGDDAVAQNINIGTGAAARVVTVGNATGATAVDVDTGTGGYDLDSLGTIEMDGVGTSNWTTDTGTVTIGTTTSGAINLLSVGAIDAQAAGTVTIDSTGGLIGIGTDDDDFAIDIGTNGERQITIGNNTGVTGVAIETGSGNLLIDSPITTMTGNLTVQGTTTTVESEIVNVADNFLYLNDGYTTPSALEGGFVTNYLPTSSSDSVATGGFTASGGGQNAEVAVDDSQTAIAAGSNGASLPQATINVGDTTGFPASGTVYVLTDGGLQTVTYTGTTATTFTGCSGGSGVMSTGGVVSESATYLTAGDFVQVSGADNQTNDGLYEVLTNENNVLTIAGIGGEGAATYQFTQNEFTTDTTVAGTITKTTVGAVQIDTSGNLQTGSGPDSTTFTWNTVTTGAATLSLQTAYDGGNSILTAGGTNVLISGTEELNVTASGGINLDSVFDADVTTFDVLMTGNNGFSIDGTADSNLTVTNTAAATPITNTIAAVNTGATSGDATVDITASSTNGDGIVEVQADTINVGTDAAVAAVTVGNNTGTTGVTIDSGTEQVEIDGVTHYGSGAGLPTATSSGFQDGDKYWDTDIEAEMRYDATRSKWLSVEAMTLVFGRDGNTQVDQYYRAGSDGRVMSATGGYIMPFPATVVGLGYTRTDTDAATFEVTEDGAATTSAAELASTALKGRINTLNGDLADQAVLGVRNKTGSTTTSNVI
ncbi:hypothetical protein N9917_00905, partial [Deltaproteobacteria bacterium]|nr:hypothetical protein [Deltaproteobacteria bacterium]